MTMTSIKNIIWYFDKEVVNVFDLGYYGVEKDYPEEVIIITKQKEESG